MKLDRRTFLSHCSLCAAGAWLMGCGDDGRGRGEVDEVDPEPDLDTVDACGVLAGGTFIGIVGFADEGIAAFGQRLGAGWDGRLYTDLATVPERLETPNDQFFTRTFLPDLLDTEAPWRIAIDGLVSAPSTLTLAELLGGPAEPKGVHVLECSGNFRQGGFGLMSAASWGGVRVMDVLARTDVSAGATRLLVEGFDEHTVPSENGHSKPGASWIFSFDQLAQSGAFFATEMNGEALPADHGAPLRLYVPGWYGCSCIKWVNRLSLVADDAPATSQMREFASRTHQDGVPVLARDYRPASLDQSAMPVRIERWRDAAGATVYRVLGILWGGEVPTQALTFEDGRGVSEPVTVCPPQTQNQLWTVWQHIWRPVGNGRHTLRMRIDDARVPTRRLDIGFYERFVDIA